MNIITRNKTQVPATIVDSATRVRLLQQFAGRQNDALRHKWTARTFELSDGRVLVEYHDHQALLVKDAGALRRLEGVRFVKNTIGFLKKNISYKIELSPEEGERLAQQEKAVKLEQFKTSVPEYYRFAVYQLATGQVLFIDRTEGRDAAGIYADLKTLASEQNEIENQLYGSDEEYAMKRLALGDPLADYEPNEHLLYPKYLEKVIQTHKLSLLKTNVYVEEFRSNLYRSANGDYVLVNEVNQKNGAGDRMPILTLRIYESLEKVSDAQEKYERLKKSPRTSEHFYKKISEAYGNRFASHVPALIDSLPGLLNFDRSQLSFDEAGLAIVDEAIRWNWPNYAHFKNCFPAILAYYGQFYILNKKQGRWSASYDSEEKVWIPQVVLADGTAAFDMIDFYGSLYEYPMPLKLAGDFEGHHRARTDDR